MEFSQGHDVPTLFHEVAELVLTVVADVLGGHGDRSALAVADTAARSHAELWWMRRCRRSSPFAKGPVI